MAATWGAHHVNKSNLTNTDT